ncbi:lipocalin family protein [Methylolobus aquaticus]
MTEKLAGPPSSTRHGKRRRSSSKRRQRIKRWRQIGSWVLLVLLFLLLLRWLGGYRPAPAVYSSHSQHQALVQLPRDDAPHDDYMEWWYYNGHLKADDGREFSFHYVFFVVNSAVGYTVAHVALTDHQTLKRYSFQKETTGNPSFGTLDRFGFVLGDLAMAGGGGKDTLKAKTRDFAFELKLENSAPAVLQGGTGLLDFHQGGTSYYYTRPRMKVLGTLSLRGKPVAVTGESWFDHQWGDFHPPSLTWNWFALQLDDGADIMLYQLTDGSSALPMFSGTYTRNGRTEVLHEPEVSLSSTTTWISPATAIPYPIAWHVRIPKHGIDVKVVPVMQNAEVDSRQTTHTIYWEGAVKVAGSHTGKGFLEVNPTQEKKAPTKGPADAR